MTRGPVHEAFAAPVVHDPKAAPTIDKEPPAPINELPPDQKPAGQNVQWISGYWAGTSLETTSSGSAVSGASRLLTASGSLATGTTLTAATSGSPEPGFQSVHRRIKASNHTCRHPPRASKPVRTRPSHRQM